MKKKSVGAVINHSAQRGGEDLMKHDKRMRLESTQRSLAQRLVFKGFNVHKHQTKFSFKIWIKGSKDIVSMVVGCLYHVIFN